MSRETTLPYVLKRFKRDPNPEIFMFTYLIFLAKALVFYDNKVIVQQKEIPPDIFQNANKLVCLIATALRIKM